MHRKQLDKETRREIHEAIRCLGYSQGQYLLKVMELLPKWMAIHGNDSMEQFFDEYKKSPKINQPLPYES